jgi:threonine/homoserine/homoserine lactone efflux protein
MGVLLTLAAVHLVGMAVPGPNVLAVSQTAVARSRSAAIAVAVGVATAALIWATSAQAGLALLISAVGGLDILLRGVGATILIVLGLRLITGSRATSHEIDDCPARLGRCYARGIFVNLSNPKSLVYFTSVFTVLVPGDASPAVRVAAVAIVFAESLSWHSLLAVVFSHRAPRRLHARAGRWVDRTVGGIFVLVGARLFSVSHH